MRRSLYARAITASVVLLCVCTCEYSLDVGPVWQIDRPRVIGLRMEVVEPSPIWPERLGYDIDDAAIAEALPGDRVELRALAVDGEGRAQAPESLDALWFQCGVEDCRIDVPACDSLEWTTDVGCEIGRGGALEFTFPALGPTGFAERTMVVLGIIGRDPSVDAQRCREIFLSSIDFSPLPVESSEPVPDEPACKVRVVVIALGYERLEMWAESSSNARELTLFVRPEHQRFRTEVAVDRNLELPRAEHAVDAERARSYPGSGGDPVRAAQNLPGVARAPGGLGLIAVRGGDPRQTAIYVDGHPVPRGFHVLPIAAVIEPSMIERVELTPGNVDAAYGGFSGGLLEIQTRRTSGTQGIHGEAHLDLFDVGGAVHAPVGPGGVAFGFRRAHVGDVVELADDVIGKTGILVPNYWDYFGRFDMPVRRRHHLSVKVFGAGDALSDTTEFTPGNEVVIDFRTSFHRFDLGYAYTGERLRASLSGAVLVDSTVQADYYSTKNRVARTPSLRGSLSYRLAKRATLLAGADFAHTHAKRQNQYGEYGPDEIIESTSKSWKFGSWLGVAFQASPKTGLLVIRPQARINVFGTSTETRASVDPRLDVRARVHERVELFAAAGQFSAPYSPFVEDRLGLIDSTDTAAAHIVIPDWLVNPLVA